MSVIPHAAVAVVGGSEIPKATHARPRKAGKSGAVAAATAEAATTRMTVITPAVAAGALDTVVISEIPKAIRARPRKAGKVAGAAVVMAGAVTTRMMMTVIPPAAATGAVDTAVGSEIPRVTPAPPKKVGKVDVVAAATPAEAVTRTMTIVTPLAAAAGAVDTAVGSEIRKATRRPRSEVGVIAN